MTENLSLPPQAHARHTRRLTGAVLPIIVGSLLALPASCLATEVHVVGVTPGLSAQVAIDGAEPITIDVGEATPEGVALLEASRNGAVLRVDGMTTALPLEAEPSGTASAARSDTVMLSADARGHFYVNGTVNGRSMRFLVDTGATLTTLSRTDARRIGLDYRSGTPSKVTTGGGEVSGWQVTLDSVRVGATTVRDVEAFVVDNDALPVGLLGMSFLGRFDMHRQGETLALRHR